MYFSVKGFMSGFLMLWITSVVQAQSPQLINFQAQLEGTTASSVAATFSVFDVATGGTALWSESYASLPVQSGRIQVLLGSANSFESDVFEGDGDRFIEISVNGETLSPRTRITSVAYALRANVADRVLGSTGNGNGVNSLNTLIGDITLAGGSNVTITPEGQTLRINATGTISGGVTALNELQGEITLQPGNNIDITPDGQNLRIDATGTMNGGVTALNELSGAITLEPGNNISITPNGQNLRIDAENGGTAGVTTLNALSGAITLVPGNNINITPDGQNLRFDAVGGTGITTINAGTGITVSDNDGPVTQIGIANNSINDTQIQDNSLGASSLASGSVGSAEIQSGAVGSSELQSSVVLGSNGRLDVENSSGQVRGTFTTLNGGGFLGLDSSDDDDGITLEVLNGNAFGRVTVHTLAGEPGVRIAGDQTGTDDFTGGSLFGGMMVLFKRDGTNRGTWLRNVGTSASNSWGVVGLTNAAHNEVIRLDGQFGNVSLAGTLSKGSGSFKIDHPLDPQNKYLSHSFVESPDMMNVYNGNVVLDENGEAWVEMPEWFDALNTDFRYQLTCIGGYAQVYIAEEISENRFKISGGRAGLKVSWMVTGIRNDPFARAQRIQVEEEKPAHERGTYLHPDAYRMANQ